MKTYFDHERLQVYQTALDFARGCAPVLERVPKSAAAHGQLDRARTSVPLNEGNGKFTAADKCKYFDSAHGSALECAACLDLLLIKNVMSSAELEVGKRLLQRAVSCLVGLIKSKDPCRFSKDPIPYDVVNGKE